MHYLRRLLTLMSMALLAACGTAQSRGPVVLAAASLTDALNEAADAWVAQGRHRPVLSFAGSSALARQIASGAPADIYISADTAWMDWLERQGLIDAATRTELTGNALVLVSAHRPALTTRALATALPDARIAVGDPDGVPAGRYARAALASLGLWDTLEPRLVRADSVRGALVLAERGEVDYAAVYASDDAASDAVRAVYRFAPASHPAISYPIARTAQSTHADADALRRFLLSPQTRAILARHGFAPADIAE